MNKQRMGSMAGGMRAGREEEEERTPGFELG